MKTKQIMILAICSLLFTGCDSCNGCNNKTNEIQNPINDNVIEDSYIATNLKNDFDIITKVEDKTIEVTLSDSLVSDETTTTTNLEMTQLSFDEWNFSLNIPTSLLSNYTKVNSIKDISLTTNEEIESTYALYNSQTFQIFNLTDKYFAIIKDTEKPSEEIKNALFSGKTKEIKELFPDNNLYSYASENISIKRFTTNDYMVFSNIEITPMNNTDIVFDGTIIYLITNDTLYYILYGETDIYNLEVVKRGFTTHIVNSLTILTPTGENIQENIITMDENNLVIKDSEYLRYDEELLEQMEELYNEKYGN